MNRFLQSALTIKQKKESGSTNWATVASLNSAFKDLHN